MDSRPGPRARGRAAHRAGAVRRDLGVADRPGQRAPGRLRARRGRVRGLPAAGPLPRGPAPDDRPGRPDDPDLQRHHPGGRPAGRARAGQPAQLRDRPADDLRRDQRDRARPARRRCCPGTWRWPRTGSWTRSATPRRGSTTSWPALRALRDHGAPCATAGSDGSGRSPRAGRRADRAPRLGRSVAGLRPAAAPAARRCRRPGPRRRPASRRRPEPRPPTPPPPGRRRSIWPLPKLACRSAPESNSSRESLACTRSTRPVTALTRSTTPASSSPPACAWQVSRQKPTVRSRRVDPVVEDLPEPGRSGRAGGPSRRRRRRCSRSAPAAAAPAARRSWPSCRTPVSRVVVLEHVPAVHDQALGARSRRPRPRAWPAAGGWGSGSGCWRWPR